MMLTKGGWFRPRKNMKWHWANGATRKELQTPMGVVYAEVIGYLCGCGIDAKIGPKTQYGSLPDLRHDRDDICPKCFDACIKDAIRTVGSNEAANRIETLQKHNIKHTILIERTEDGKIGRIKNST